GLGDLLQAACDAGATEVLLRQHVSRDLRPRRRHLDGTLLEDDGAVWIADFGIASTKRHSFEWRSSCSRKPTLQTHSTIPRAHLPSFLLLAGCSMSWIEHAHMGTERY